MRLQGKVAIITGAGSGIGRESALLFAAEGATVVVADMDELNGRRTAESIEGQGGKAAFVAVNVAQGDSVQNLVRVTEEEFGKLDIMFNNAGIMPDADGSILETTEAVWNTVIDVNLKGVFFGCKYAIPAMQRNGAGSIINVASFVALVGSATSQIAYTASKGGVLALTREIAVEFARQNIRANALCPGPVDTPLLQAILSVPEKRARRLAHIPPGRPAQAREIANAALFLASDESSYVNGSTFTVDAGISGAYVTAE